MRRAALLCLLLSTASFAQSAPEAAVEQGRAFFQHLLAGDAKALTQLSGFPFQLDARRVATPGELFQLWLQQLRAKRLDLLTLDGLEVLSPAEMEKRHGAPPARLASLPWRGPRTFVAVANVSGHGAVAVLKEGPNGWRAVGYTD